MTTQSQVIVPEIITAIPATKSVNIVTPVMAEFPHFDVSSRYIHCNTMEVVDAVRDCGWEVARTACARVRRPDRQGFQKHFVWLRQPRQKMEVGDCELQLLMVNSHDGTSSLQLMAGLFRLVCRQCWSVCGHPNPAYYRGHPRANHRGRNQNRRARSGP